MSGEKASISEEEYRSLEFFPGIPRYEMGSPPERLAKYRRNVIALGGVILFLYVAGVEFVSISAVGTEGKIDRPELVPAFLSLVFLYNFLMFEVTLNKEVAKNVWISTDRQQLSQAIAFHIATRGVRQMLARSDDSAYASEWRPVNRSASYEEGRSIVSFQIPHNLWGSMEEVLKLPGFSAPPVLSRQPAGTVLFSYELTEADRRWFKENAQQLSMLKAHEVMDFAFPMLFGLIVALVTIYLNATPVLVNLPN